MSSQAVHTKQKMHPHKFNLWVAIGSMIMMFAGLTSAYIVKRNQAGWQTYDMPAVFWISTALILISSLTVHLSLKAFRVREMARYRWLMLTTLVLGVLFVITQYVGFCVMIQSLGYDEILELLKANVSYSFLVVIVGLHALHVAGGILALLFMVISSYSRVKRNYSTVPVEVVATYWHFVDILWIYLYVFLWMIK